MSWISEKGSAARIVVLACIAVVTALAVLLPPETRRTGPDRVTPAPRITGEIQHFTPKQNPRAVPDVAFRDGKGDEVTFRDFHGKVVVLNFWATWCAPCVHEMPSLDRLAARLADRPVALVALNEDRGGAEVAAPFLEKLKLGNLPLYLDPEGAVQRALEVGSLPTTIVIDAEGREVGRLVGPADWSSPEAVALIETFLPATD